MTTTDLGEMLLVEDLLLLLLDDDDGHIAGEATLFYTLGGAVLVELAMTGAVDVEKGGFLSGPKVKAVASVPPVDPLLREAYEKVAEKPRGVQSLLITLGTPLRAKVLDRLVERGHIRRESSKLLGFIPSTRMPAEGTAHEVDLMRRVRAVLVDGAVPDARTGAVAALLSASGTLPQLHRSIPWSGDVYARGKALEKGEWGAQAVSEAVVRTAVATTAGIAAAAAAVTGAATSS